MPDLDELQREYQRLSEVIDRQNELRDSDSDDYDMDRLDEAFRDRNHVGRQIKEAGGTPGGAEPPSGGSEMPPSGTGSTPGTPPAAAPDPNTLTSVQLGQELDKIRDDPPHPDVRMEDGKVVGGTPEELQEQVEWRGKVEQLEHERTAAQADEAWVESGGPDGFTDAELKEIEQTSEKIDEIQERLDAVDADHVG